VTNVNQYLEALFVAFQLFENSVPGVSFSDIDDVKSIDKCDNCENASEQGRCVTLDRVQEVFRHVVKNGVQIFRRDFTEVSRHVAEQLFGRAITRVRVPRPQVGHDLLDDLLLLDTRCRGHGHFSSSSGFFSSVRIVMSFQAGKRDKQILNDS